MTELDESDLPLLWNHDEDEIIDMPEDEKEELRKSLESLFANKPRMHNRIPRVYFHASWKTAIVGFFWDSGERTLHVFPLPFLGVSFDFRRFITIPDSPVAWQARTILKEKDS